MISTIELLCAGMCMVIIAASLFFKSLLLDVMVLLVIYVIVWTVVFRRFNGR